MKSRTLNIIVMGNRWPYWMSCLGYIKCLSNSCFNFNINTVFLCTIIKLMTKYKITNSFISFYLALYQSLSFLFLSFLLCLFLYTLIINGAITAPIPAINVQIPVIGDTHDL
jgi:hypothetical protein